MKEVLNHNRKKMKSLKTGIFASVILAAFLCLVPFLCLSFFIHPVNDDYFYAITHLNVNCFDAVIDSYANWSGRFLATFISSLNPLSLYGSDAVFYYKVSSFVLILIFFVSLFIGFRILLGKYLSNLKTAFLASLFFILYISLCPKISELFYWFSSYTAFTIPNILAFILLSTLPIKNKYLFSIQCLLSFLIPGGNEVTAVLFVMLLLFLSYATRNKRIYALAIISMVSILLVILSPGNGVRMSGQLSAHPYLWSALLSTGQTLSWFFLWLPVLIVATLLYVPLVGVCLPRFEMFHVKFRYYVLFFGVTVFLAHIPPTLGLSSVMIGRTANSLYFFFIILYFIGVHILLDKYREKIDFFISKCYSEKMEAVLVFCFIFICPFSLESPVLTAYLDLISGKASTYDSMWNERDRVSLQADSQRVVTFEAFVCPPKTIYINDLETDAGGQFCNAYKDYNKLKCDVQVEEGEPVFYSNFETVFRLGKSVR